MKSTIKFFSGWLAFYLFIAFICLLANWKTMDYADCLNHFAVQLVGWGLGWLIGWGISIPSDKIKNL